MANERQIRSQTDRASSVGSMRHRISRDAGFTLLEALLALVILAAVLVVLYQAMAGNWHSIGAAEREKEALLVARSELARAGVETPLAPGTTSGKADNGLDYQVTISPYLDGDADWRNPIPEAYWVRVTVSWRSGLRPLPRTLELTTLKRPPPK
ncbi:MAG: prepilin-type N-terminal cleavage/methylation domain-containing protein [Alphaproteobacteria bacterium]|nr:prepilin-type N-terminal cleavage/methylation domain-containing protein [Alphaproteobacteria bacterium]